MDDNPIVRDVLSIILKPRDEFSVCGTAPTIKAALKKAAQTEPDIVLIDLSLKGEDGLELIPKFKNAYPRIKVVIYSLHDEVYYIDSAKKAGADGYVVKSEPPRVLIETLLNVQQNQKRFPEPTADE